MAWDSRILGFEDQPVGPGRSQDVELVGPHLRVSAQVDLGRFGRLTDLVNHSRGFVRIHEARLLRRNGEPTALVVPELYVNQDEITFIAQAAASTDDVQSTSDWGAPDTGGSDPALARHSRRFVVFTSGHAITGSMDVLREMTLANFVDSPDPRFVPMTAVTARSLADRRVISHYDLLLINRTQMTAVAQADDELGATAAEHATSEALDDPGEGKPHPA